MKWLAVALAVAVIIPLGRHLRSRPKWQSLLLFLLAVLPFTVLVERASLNLSSHEWYRGDARGFEVTIIDLIALTLHFALPKARHPAPYRRLAGAYILIAALTLFWAAEPLYAAFGLWRLVRAFFLGIVVARACEDPEMPPFILHGFAWGLVILFGHGLLQRYGYGVHQVSGSFAHQNSMGMAVNLVAPVLFALLLGNGTRKRFGALALLSGGGLVLLSLSRGALVMLPLALAIVYVGSMLRRPTKVKIRVGLAAIAIGVLILLKSFDTVVDRFLYAPEESAAARELFEEGASMMLDDHPFGVGLNNFSRVLGQDYADELRLDELDRDAIVHHVYWLTAAELGWLGILAYLLLTAAPIVLGLRSFRLARDDPRGDVILGLTAGLMVTAAQGVLEWLARQTIISYLVWIGAAMILALVRQLRAEQTAPTPTKAPPRQ